MYHMMTIPTTKRALLTLLLTFSILLSVSSQARASEFFEDKSYVQSFEDIVEIFKGEWGDFKGRSPPVTFNDVALLACGAQLQIEDSQKGSNYDDTAVNGLKLHFCGASPANEAPWSVKSQKTVFTGERGYMKRKVMCPTGTYIIGAQVRYQDRIGGDNVGLTGLKIKCAKLNHKGKVTIKTVFPGERGEWKSWVTFPKGKGVISAEVQYADYDPNKDNTGMNGLRFEVSPPKIVFGADQPFCSGKKKRGLCRKEDKCVWTLDQGCIACSDIKRKKDCNETPKCTWLPPTSSAVPGRCF